MYRQSSQIVIILTCVMLCRYCHVPCSKDLTFWADSFSTNIITNIDQMATFVLNGNPSTEFSLRNLHCIVCCDKWGLVLLKPEDL